MENKDIFTALSQGAVGGAFGYFLLMAFVALYHPSEFNILFPFALPMILVLGAAIGMTKAMFIWLAGVIFKRKLNVIARASIGIGVMTPLVAAIYCMTQAPGSDGWLLSWLLGFASATGLPVALMTGSSLSPDRIIVLGMSRHRALRNIGSWLEIPVGFLLRAASVFGLLEALMTLAIAISARRVEGLEFPAPEYFNGIALAVLYFAVSTYFSIRSPGKFLLLPAAILINLPSTFLMLNLRSMDSWRSSFLAYIFIGFICLWAIYTLGRMIALTLPLSLNQILKEIADARNVTPGVDCEAHS